MGWTNFPGGITSLGVPVVPSGLFGKASKSFFVDGAAGLDGNSGTTPKRAVKTVTKALSLCTDKAGDVIYLMNDGNTSGTSRDTATINWSLDNTHLIGVCASTMLSQRARISPPTSATAIVTPQLLVSGNGNSFSNVSLFEGTNEAVDSTCVSITGSRNYFNNVAMMNMANSTTNSAADRAGSETLLITAGEENTFDGCYIGMDTAARSAANANVRFASAATRNIFRDCFFPMQADANSPIFIDANTSGAIDRFAWFKNCVFHNGVNSTATEVLLVASVHASAGGSIILENCSHLGAAQWEVTASTNVFGNMPIPDMADDASGGKYVVYTT
jgi:hypothetical protein